MRILVGMIPMPHNRFLIDLNNELGKTCEIVHSHEQFWTMEGGPDIVHIHFPEFLTFEIEACIKNGLTEAMLKEVETRLAYWKSKVPIVVTRHVFMPHHRMDDPLFTRLYELVYRHADAVVHFAEASRDEYLQRYGEALGGVTQRHAIIPHHNYESLKNEITRRQARTQLRLNSNANVILAFGTVRNDWEANLCLATIKGLNSARKVLIASTWYERLTEVRPVRLKYWLRDLKRLYYRLHPRYHFHYGFVDESDVQQYVNACDVLFIPRGHVLNSGNMVLGFTFGRVVVGPDSGTVGQILRETGNPVFDPDRPETAVAAVEKGLELARQGHGEKNRELALSEWTVAQCADKYKTLFDELIAARKESTEHTENTG